MPVESRPPPSSAADLQIRPAISTDIDALARLESVAFATDRLTRKRFAALAKSPSARLLVADSSGVIAGYVLVLTRRGSRAARLYSLAVSPQAAGRGIGSLLLNAAERAALTGGAELLRLEVRADNDAALRLYERHGYRGFGRREDYYADGMAAVRYERHLSTPAADADGIPEFGRAA